MPSEDWACHVGKPPRRIGAAIAPRRLVREFLPPCRLGSDESVLAPAARRGEGWPGEWTSRHNRLSGRQRPRKPTDRVHESGLRAAALIHGPVAGVPVDRSISFDLGYDRCSGKDLTGAGANWRRAPDISRDQLWASCSRSALAAPACTSGSLGNSSSGRRSRT